MSASATRQAQAATLKQRGVNLAGYGTITDPEDVPEPEAMSVLITLLGCGYFLTKAYHEQGGIERYETTPAEDTDPEGNGAGPAEGGDGGDGEGGEEGDGEEGGGGEEGG